ncbi:MAG TPA: hypothetical protein VE549_07185 [Myxococcaceae bacterium]|nr:hypothetical protein [Myxococcaceae bacterium]
MSFALAAALTAGCGTTLSTLQTADVTDVGQVRVTGGLGVYLPLGPALTFVDQGIQQGRAIADARARGETYVLSEQAREDLLTAALALAVMPPWVGWELSARTGVWKDRMDVGLRYAVNAVRVDAKYRLLHRGDGPEVAPLRRRSFDLAIGVGASRYLFDNPVLEILEAVDLGEYSRWDLEAPVLASLDVGDVLKLYGGVRYAFSSTSLDARLIDASLEASAVSGAELGLPRTVRTHYVGGVAGVAAGYRWVHAMAELNGGYTFCNPIVFGRPRRLGGPTVYPAVGISVRFP